MIQRRLPNKLSRAWVIWAPAAIAVLACLLTDCRERWCLLALRYELPGSDRTAVCERLGLSQKGVRLALRDMDCWGGTAAGASRRILVTSPLRDVVEPGLRRVAESTDALLARRIEAYNILWRRTGDTDCLLQLFRLVSPPGPPSTECGRRLIVAALDAHERAMSLMARHDRPLSVNEEEFVAMVHEIGVAQAGAARGKGTH